MHTRFAQFFLHEAQAQLQLALFGVDDPYMEETNEKLRHAFAGKDSSEYGYTSKVRHDTRVR
jgi:hypothetical protein